MAGPFAFGQSNGGSVVEEALLDDLDRWGDPTAASSSLTRQGVRDCLAQWRERHRVPPRDRAARYGARGGQAPACDHQLLSVFRHAQPGDRLAGDTAEQGGRAPGPGEPVDVAPAG